jgi:glycosyltransferase involved in cell wall biosynthesis
MPLSIIEAMASGAICIAPATNVTRMLVKDGVTGLLFDYSSGASGLKQAILRLEAMSLDERMKMSESARSYFEKQFTLEQHLRHISAIYQIKLALPAKEQPVMELIKEAHALAI